MTGKQLTPVQAGREQEIVKYLREHKKDVIKNPVAKKRDKLAMYAVLTNKEFFKSAWKVYAKARK